MIRFRPLPIATAFTLAGCVVLILLGNWQLRRLAWKETLIEAVETRAGAAPIAFETGLIARDAFEYLPVRASGVFEHDKELYVFSQLEDRRVGFQVFTPLALPDGRAIWIDRGFILPSFKDPSSRQAGQIEGPVTVTGLLRQTQTGNAFTPEPSLSERVFYVRDLTAMGDLAGERALTGAFIAADATPNPGGLPEGGHTRLTFRNDHLSYALTWYAFAVVLIGVYLAYHWQQGRLRVGGR